MRWLSLITPKGPSFKLHETVRLLVRHGGKTREALTLLRAIQVAQDLTVDGCENLHQAG